MGSNYTEVNEDYNINFDDQSNYDSTININDDDDISELIGKDSNFVFFFGTSGSGKSVILASLLYYMRTKLGVFRPKEGTPNTREAEILLENFFEELRQGKLPNRTTKDQVTRFDLVFDPNNESKKIQQINLTFLETAGGNHTEIKAGGKYHNCIQLYLNATIPLYFIIVAGYDTAREDDFLITRFFDTLENYRKNLRSVNAILVVSKWDKSGNKMVNNSEELNRFVDRNLPMTSALLDRYKLSKTYFTIGSLENDTKGIERLKTFNTYTPKLLSNWLYKSITGYPIDYEGTFWEKFKWSLGL
jgi:hypothetical protein